MKNQRKFGAILSYVYIVVNAIATFLYTPFLLRYLGQSEYGLYSLSISIMSYLSMLDLGFGNSMIRFISKYKALDKPDEEQKINGLFLIFYIIIGIITLLIGLFLLKNTNLLFGAKFTAKELSTINYIIIILVINIAISFPLSIFGSYIVASEKFVFQKMLLIIKAILYPCVLIAFLLNGAKSIGVVLIMSIFNLALNLANMYYCKKTLKIKFKIGKDCFKYFKEIFNYSFFIFLAIIVDNIYNNTDQVILGSICGTIAVSIYGVANQIRTMYEQISTSISGVFLPKVVSMVEKKMSKENVSEFFNRISKIQMFLLCLVLFGFICFGKEFVLLWSGKEYIDAYYIILILLIPSTIPLTQNISLLIIQAENKHKFRAILYLIISILNIIISIPLAKIYGGIGAALGSAICLIIGNIVIMNFYYYKVIKIDVITYWKNFIKLSLISSIYSVIFKLIIFNLNINNWIELFIVCFIYAVFYIIVIYTLFLNKVERSNINQMIKKIVYKYTPKFFIRNYIIFESNPDMSDNAKAVFDYFIKREVNKNNKLIWFVNNSKDYKKINIKNVVFVSINSKNIFSVIRKKYYNYTAKLILDCNKYVHKMNKYQVRIHLMHGIGYKKVEEYQSYCGEVDYFTVPGTYFNKAFSKGYKSGEEKFIPLGYPRNDVLYNNVNNNLKSKLKINKNSKVILWLPTYRNHKDQINKKKNTGTGIPIIKNINMMRELNKYLVENNIYIYLKLHPAQDIKFISNVSLSNLKIISDRYLNDLGLTLYEFLSGTDSLITDYSSVYFDYLLTGNLIGVTLDDYREIHDRDGFICEDYSKVIKGEHIYNYDQFIEYLKKVVNGKYNKKMYLKEQEKYYKYVDGNSTKRLYEFIKSKNLI